ncbi:MAG: lactate/malate family dehydrogenase, partial [Alphaproteobacteria bacterium]
MKKIQKISIIGAGAIGTQTALYLQQEAMYLQKNFLREIILYNHNYDLAYGEASDIVDSMAFHEQFSGIEKLDCKVIPSYQLKDIEGSDIIIVAAGAAKTALKHKNRSLELPVTYQIAKKLAIAIKKYAKHALVIVISNPVDLITWYIQEFSGLPKNIKVSSNEVCEAISDILYEIIQAIKA